MRRIETLLRKMTQLYPRPRDRTFGSDSTEANSYVNDTHRLSIDRSSVGLDEWDFGELYT